MATAVSVSLTDGTSLGGGNASLVRLGNPGHLREQPRVARRFLVRSGDGPAVAARIAWGVSHRHTLQDLAQGPSSSRTPVRLAASPVLSDFTIACCSSVGARWPF